MPVRDDSRRIEPGDVFVAVRGRTSDGHAHVAAALARGAVAVVVEHEQPSCPVPQVVVPRGAAALGVLVAQAAGHPARAMQLVGITGTNGKTTTSYVVEHILRAAGGAPGLIGTVTYRWHEAGVAKVVDAPYTTPTPQVLHDTFAAMHAAHSSHVVMEVSSAALVMDRLAGVAFTVAAFSNLTQDHLDVHGDMASYAAAKRLLFSDHLAAGGTAVINVDDPAGEGMAAAANGQRVLRVSTVPGTAAERDHLGQHLDGRSHRRGVGVVAIDDDVAAGHGDDLGAHRRRAGPCKAGERDVDLDAGAERARQRAGRIDRGVATTRAARTRRCSRRWAPTAAAWCSSARPRR